nr:immunoglobulin light chain junction region [Macaca mulatta]MOV61051.1 immunoglobulin light chain junction region [Macaca mulatta]MOV61316.1 immunoglobulin light chain junction region [Macaca mulatta]MOV61718.1 immunoglobulin light chain junction region [Macaca mulatta]MOV61856.1 immunoglobulin light chain junction region [Macaca mulatta]
CQQHNTYPYTF